MSLDHQSSDAAIDLIVREEDSGPEYYAKHYTHFEWPEGASGPTVGIGVMRATGANPKMARAQGIGTEFQVYVGMALSNGLVAIGGSLFAQTNGFADVTTGVGTLLSSVGSYSHCFTASIAA